MRGERRERETERQTERHRQGARGWGRHGTRGKGGVIESGAKKRLGTIRSQERERGHSLPQRPQWDYTPAHTLLLDLQSQNSGRVKFCCFELWALRQVCYGSSKKPLTAPGQIQNGKEHWLIKAFLTARSISAHLKKQPPLCVDG